MRHLTWDGKRRRGIQEEREPHGNLRMKRSNLSKERWGRAWWGGPERGPPVWEGEVTLF